MVDWKLYIDSPQKLALHSCGGSLTEGDGGRRLRAGGAGDGYGYGDGYGFGNGNGYGDGNGYGNGWGCGGYNSVNGGSSTKW